jgi:tripartite ATP-independent transporter DctM subunit
MRRFNYSGALSTGCLAAGGTLGILIPPSIALVIYAIIVEESIPLLFIAAITPGLLAVILFMLTISIYVRLDRSAGPPGETSDWAERFRSLGDIWPIAAIFFLVIGGIYLGWFTPTEGAAFGAVATGVLAVAKGGMRWTGFRESLLGAGRITAMGYFILIGAEVYNAFLARTRLPFEAAGLVSSLDVPPVAIIVVMLLIYLVLGCVMDSLAMILLTVPVFYPIVLSLDLGMTPTEASIWFGIIVLITVEVGLITPPFGLIVFVINSMAENVPITASFRGVIPFLISEFIRVSLLVAFPGIVLWLIRL